MAEGDPLPIPVERLRPEMLVVNGEAGCKALPGRTMLEGPGKKLMSFFAWRKAHE